MNKNHFKYYIYTRYEYYSPSGKTFTDWFIDSEGYADKNKADEYLKKQKEMGKAAFKSTKLKHEYELRYLDETLVVQRRLHRPKGRPKKTDKEYLDKIIKELNKSGSIIINNDVKNYIYNNKEENQYIEEHIKDKTKYLRYWYDEEGILTLFLKDRETEKVYD